jgi:hypothetical protein
VAGAWKSNCLFELPFLVDIGFDYILYEYELELALKDTGAVLIFPGAQNDPQIRRITAIPHLVLLYFQ